MILLLKILGILCVLGIAYAIYHHISYALFVKKVETLIKAEKEKAVTAIKEKL